MNPNEPAPGDTDDDIAHKLEQWLWDELDPNFGEYDGWEGRLVTEAIKRLRRG